MYLFLQHCVDRAIPLATSGGVGVAVWGGISVGSWGRLLRVFSFGKERFLGRAEGFSSKVFFPRGGGGFSAEVLGSGVEERWYFWFRKRACGTVIGLWFCCGLEMEHFNLAGFSARCCRMMGMHDLSVHDPWQRVS